MMTYQQLTSLNDSLDKELADVYGMIAIQLHKRLRHLVMILVLIVLFISDDKLMEIFEWMI